MASGNASEHKLIPLAREIARVTVLRKSHGEVAAIDRALKAAREEAGTNDIVAHQRAIDELQRFT